MYYDSFTGLYFNPTTGMVFTAAEIIGFASGDGEWGR